MGNFMVVSPLSRKAVMLYDPISALSLAKALHAGRVADAESLRLARQARRTRQSRRGDATSTTARTPHAWAMMTDPGA